jgi:hypothetical protein
MGRRKNSKVTIDRIDNDGDYCKENCKWSTIDEQANNRRNNRKVLLKGKLISIRELSNISGMNYVTLQSRLLKNNYNLKKVLNKKLRNCWVSNNKKYEKFKTEFKKSNKF